MASARVISAIYLTMDLQRSPGHMGQPYAKITLRGWRQCPQPPARQSR